MASSSSSSRLVSLIPSLAPSSTSPASLRLAAILTPRRLASSSSASSTTSPSSFTVHNPPATTATSQARRPRTRQPRPNKGPLDAPDAHNQALYQFRVALTQGDLDQAWAARQKLSELGTLRSIDGVGMRDLRKLVERARSGVGKSTTLDLDQCAEALIQEQIAFVVQATKGGGEIVNWMIHYIRIGREEHARKIAMDLLAASEVQKPIQAQDEQSADEVAESTPELQKPIQSQDKQSADEVAESTPELQKTIQAEDKQSADEVVEPTAELQTSIQAEDKQSADEVVEPTPESALHGEQASEVKMNDAPEACGISDSHYHLMSSKFFPEMLILLAWLALKKEGNVTSIIPMFRQLLMPDRTKLWIFSRPRIENVLKLIHGDEDEKLPNITQEVNQILPAIYALELAWGLDHPQGQARISPLARLFGDLLGTAHFAAVNGLLDQLFEAAKGPSAWLWVDGLPRPSLVPPSAKQPDVDDFLWSTLLTDSLVKGNTEIASKVWSQLSTFGIKPSTQVYHALLKGYAQLGQWKSVHSVWDELSSLRKKGHPGPDVHCYTTMIRGLFDRWMPEEALVLFGQIQGRTVDGRDDNVSSRTILYNAVLSGLIKNKRIVQADSLLKSMLYPKRSSWIPAPNVSTLNTLLRDHAHRGDLTALMDLLNRSQTWNVTPDVITYTTVLDALARHAAPGSSAQAVNAVLGMMKSQGIAMTPVTWTVLLKAILKGPATKSPADGQATRDFAALKVKREQIMAGLALVDVMIKDGFKPNEVTWTSLMQAGCQLQWLLDAEHPLKEDLSFRLESPSGIGSTVHPVAPLNEVAQTMDLLCRARPGTFFVLSLLDSMRKDQLQPNRKTYHFLLVSMLGAVSPSTSDLEQMEAARVAFVRGLSVLDRFCHRLFLAADPSSPSLTPFQRSTSTPIRLKHLVPPIAPVKGSRLDSNPPPEPNDVSMQVILDALLERMASLDQLGERVRVENGSQMLKEVRKDIELTKTVMEEALVRLRVVHLLRGSRRERMADGVSKKLAKVRKEAMNLLMVKDSE